MACMLCNRRIVITVQLCYRKKGQIMNGLQKWKRQSPLPTLFIPSTCRQRSVLAQRGQHLRRRPFGNKRILKKTFPKYQPHESRTLIYHTLMGLVFWLSIYLQTSWILDDDASLWQIDMYCIDKHEGQRQNKRHKLHK